MKLKAILSGITLMLLFWMTAAFLRPVPTDSYEQYFADSHGLDGSTKTETASVEIVEEETGTID